MKLLITGSSGLLGASLVHAAKKKNWDLILPSSSDKNNLYCDFSAPGQVDDLLKGCRPDYLINLAALTNVDACEESPPMAYRLNAAIPKNIHDTIGRLGISTKVIHISTDHLYDSPSPSKESDLAPVNIYSFSKLLGESYLPGALILRTNFVGKSRSAKKESFTDWIYKSLSQKKSIPLFFDSIFSPLNVETLSNYILGCTENFQAGVFNIGSTGSMSKYDFGLRFAQALGLDDSLIQKSAVKDVSLKARRPASMAMDSSRFMSSFKLKLPSIKETLATVVADYR